MTQENVEIVRRAYEEVSARLDMPPGLYAPDFETDSTDVGPGNFGVVSGLDLTHARLREYWEMFDGFRVEIEEVIHADARRVVTAVRDGGRLRDSDKEVSNRFFHVWTLTGGRIVHLSIHTDRSGALEATGLQGWGMLQENVETGQLFVDAVNRGDREAALRLVHPEVVFEPLRAATEGAFRGREGVDRFLTDTAQTFELFRVDLRDLRTLEDGRVLGLGSIRVRGRGSGIETDIPTAAIAEYRNGLLWRYKDYGVTEKALEAAGLAG